MAEHNIGALDASLRATIWPRHRTERDYARKIALKDVHHSSSSLGDHVEDRYSAPGRIQSVEECMAIMTARAVRHLPSSSTRSWLELYRSAIW